jgi:hypothetical protein
MNTSQGYPDPPSISLRLIKASSPRREGISQGSIWTPAFAGMTIKRFEIYIKVDAIMPIVRQQIGIRSPALLAEKFTWAVGA